MSKRTDQVAALLQKEVGNQIALIELPFLTTISKVEVTPDLKWGKVWITVLTEKSEDEKAVLNVLKEHIFDLQGEVNRHLKMKIVPRISFVIDKSEQYSAHINKLIQKTHEEDGTKDE